MLALTRTPMGGLPPLAYAQDGDVLTVGGVAFDFTGLPEGGTLAQAAVPGGWLASPVTRTDGTLRLTVIEPVAPVMPAREDGSHPLVQGGGVDWGQMETPAGRDDAALAAWRAEASLPTPYFAIAAWQAGLISAADAEGWACGSSLPGVVTAALATIPDEAERTAARILIRGAQTVTRADPLVALLQASMGLSDEAVDALFQTA